MANSKFAERLKRLRSEIDYTLNELFLEVGIPESTLSRYETGKRKRIAFDDITKLARFFGVDPAYLSGEIDEFTRTRPAEPPASPSWLPSLLTEVKQSGETVAAAILHQELAFVNECKEQRADYTTLVREMMRTMAAQTAAAEAQKAATDSLVDEIRGLRADFQRAISGPDASGPPAPPQPAPTKSTADALRAERDARHAKERQDRTPPGKAHEA